MIEAPVLALSQAGERNAGDDQDTCRVDQRRKVGLTLSSTLYIGNLAHETTEADLLTEFTPFGKIVSTKVMSDRRGRAKGFGFVEMADKESAREAMEKLRGKELNGRTMDIVLEDRKNRKGGGRRRR